MKKWVSENIFLIDAVVYFLFTIFLWVSYFIDTHLWGEVLFWCFIAMMVYLSRLEKLKKQYIVDSDRFLIMTILVLLFIFVMNGAIKIFDKNTFLYFLLISPLWKIGIFATIQQLLNHHNYVNGIEVEKKDFWLQDEK